jgi:hypothetical protein
MPTRRAGTVALPSGACFVQPSQAKIGVIILWMRRAGFAAASGLITCSLLGVLCSLSSAYGASAGHQTGLGSAATSVYTEHDVLGAFAKVGDRLADTGFSTAYVSPVSVLESVKPRQGWDVTVYVYPSVSEAEVSYRENHVAWRSGGAAAVELANLVVVAARQGSAPATGSLALPALVARALALVHSSS